MIFENRESISKNGGNLYIYFATKQSLGNKEFIVFCVCIIALTENEIKIY